MRGAVDEPTSCDGDAEHLVEHGGIQAAVRDPSGSKAARTGEAARGVSIGCSFT
jgi:hypothetical protein